MQLPTISWLDAAVIANAEKVDDALRNFAEERSQDAAVHLVQEIVKHARGLLAPASEGSPV